MPSMQMCWSFKNAKTPANFLHKTITKPYHIDYAFGSDDVLKHLVLKLGQFEDWIDKSHHMPLRLTSGHDAVVAGCQTEVI